MLRRQIGANQEEFAKMLGLKRRGTVSELERMDKPRKVTERTKLMLDVIAEREGFKVEGANIDLFDE